VSDQLKPKFDGKDGALPEEEVDDVVEEALDELRDAPVQTFVPLIAEKKARERLQDRVAKRDRSGRRTT